MMNEIFLRFFFDTEIKSEKEKIRKILYGNLMEIYGEAVVDEDDETDIENSREVAFAVKLKCITREKCLFNIIRDAQKLGDEWSVSGLIEWGFNLWSNKPYLIGIKAININIYNGFPPKIEVSHNDD